MNLGGWGPSDECREAIAEVQREIQNRFGFRRLVTWTSRQFGLVSRLVAAHRGSSTMASWQWSV